MSDLPNIYDLEKQVRDQTIYVVGGGKSFSPTAPYFKKIPRERTLCLNSALEDFDKCLACMYMDSSWEGKNRKLLKQARQKYTLRVNNGKRVLKPYRGENIIYIRNISISKCSFEAAYRLEPYDVCGNNVGVCAIDLLEQMGARQIVLLGFDCNSEDGKSHYHERYDLTVKQSTYDNKIIPCFESLAEHLKKRGTFHKVINLSPGSKLKCLQSKDINKFDFR